jgi:hypothetical protein
MSARPAVTEKTLLQHFSRQWFFGALRTVLWVVVITVLIWVYADLQFTEERNIPATLRIHADSAGALVLLEPTEEITINFRVKGDRYSIDRFISRLANAEGKLQYAAARELEPGEHSERTKELLARLPEIREAGLEVISARPTDVTIHLDELKRLRSVRVEPVFTGGKALEPKLEPERVDLLVPATQLERIDKEELTLKTAPVDLSRYGVGQVLTNVRATILPPPGVKGARLVQAVARVSCKVGWQAEKRFTVLVHVTTPPAWLEDRTWQEYVIKYKPGEQKTRTIKVLGNRIDVDKLKAEDIRAYIELTEAAKDVKSWESAEVKVILPPELNVRLDPEPIPPVDYRLEKRSAAGEGP